MLSGTASSGGSGHSYLSQLSTFYQGCEHFDFLTSDETQHLHVLFTRAIHRGATPFTMFEIQHLYAIFSTLRNSFKLQSPEKIGQEILRSEYKRHERVDQRDRQVLGCLHFVGRRHEDKRQADSESDGMRSSRLLFSSFRNRTSQGERR
jgi:hypothetical protein